MATLADQTVPAHVPPHLVHDFDFRNLADPGREPVSLSEDLDRQGVPPIFFSPRYGGHWVLRRYEDVRDGYSLSEHFASSNHSVPPMAVEHVLVPNGIDPPDHTRYRNLLNPLFSPVAIARIQGWIREYAASLIDGFVASGRCDFVADFSAKLPTTVFLKMMGLPLDELPRFLAWEHAMFRGPFEEREGTYAQVIDYLNRTFEDKRRNPGEDVMSFLIGHRDEDGTPLDPVIIQNIALLLYLAGLDTVTNTMSSIWHQLATDDAVRTALLENPKLRSDGLDELLRVHAMPNLSRRVRHDFAFRGVSMKAGDRLVMLTHRANRDPAWLDDPESTDLTRRPRDFLTFGWGPHRCLGSLVARNELRATLDEWLARIPAFELDPERPAEAFGGQVMGYATLPLRWSLRP